MKLLLSLALLVLASTFSVAQDTAAEKCPSISVTGPAGVVDVGELASYTATVSNAERYSLEYVWSVSAGRIKDGQGTHSIWVIQPNTDLTATVEVRGLPDGCPATASEWHCGLRAPDPVKFYELQPNKIFTRPVATEVASVMLENPNNQLYILAGDVGRKSSPAFQQKQKTITNLLTKLGVTPDRITIAAVYSDVELFQFWRVPPGASNPSCAECNKLEQARSKCPSISVQGPAGVTEPGGSIVFTANFSGDSPTKIKYSWVVSAGIIRRGQGSSQVTVEAPRDTQSVTATVQVTGLNEDCENSASETVPVFAGDPLLIDEFGPSPLREQIARIDSAVIELRGRTGGRLVFIEYFPTEASGTKITARKTWLTNQLLRRHRLRFSQFEIVIPRSKDKDISPRTKIYFVVDGAYSPSP